VRSIGIAVLAALVFAAVPASGAVEKTFPRLRIGIGAEPTTGGGVVAGDTFVTHAAVIAWNRRFDSLNLYLLPGKSVTCANLLRVSRKPGHVIQVYVTNRPRVNVGRPVANPQVAFVTVYRNPKIPMHVAGLKEGGRLTFTRLDTYPGGVWHGTFEVPRRQYGDGKVYGYNGTFAAKWCDLRR
jgi:hypothetical protein